MQAFVSIFLMKLSFSEQLKIIGKIRFFNGNQAL